jgi:hypothetical protein
VIQNVFKLYLNFCINKQASKCKENIDFDFFKSKLNKMCFDGFFLQYEIIYCTKEGFGHLIAVKVVIQFEVPKGDNKLCQPVEN